MVHGINAPPCIRWCAKILHIYIRGRKFDNKPTFTCAWLACCYKADGIKWTQLFFSYIYMRTYIHVRLPFRKLAWSRCHVRQTRASFSQDTTTPRLQLSTRKEQYSQRCEFVTGFCMRARPKLINILLRTGLSNRIFGLWLLPAIFTLVLVKAFKKSYLLFCRCFFPLY